MTMPELEQCCDAVDLNRIFAATAYEVQQVVRELDESAESAARIAVIEQLASSLSDSNMNLKGMEGM